MNLISLPETKNYLRVDHCEDDKLILTLIDTAQRLVMDVGRMTEKQLAETEETSRQAMLYTVSYLYENRNTADYHVLTLTLRALLFAQREPDRNREAPVRQVTILKIIRKTITFAKLFLTREKNADWNKKIRSARATIASITADGFQILSFCGLQQEYRSHYQWSWHLDTLPGTEAGCPCFQPPFAAPSDTLPRSPFQRLPFQ